MQEILEKLTDAQREAVCHLDGPLLILAGPGSGKTRVVTHRVAHLISCSIPPRQILALTFTNKAADEMRLRVEELAPRQPVWMGTFHSFCARLLRQHAPLVGLAENFSIYDTQDSRNLLADAIDEAAVELTHVTPDQIAREISTAKNNLLAAEAYVPRRGRGLGSIVQRVYPLYRRRLLETNAVDFDDLLLHVATMLRENPELRRALDERYRYILVDEYQDTNFAQYVIVRALSQDYPNLAVTGDPDQSIYGWRGANLNNILEFEKDYPQVRVVRLEQNYRSTKSILRVADQLIAYNTRRKRKSLFTDNPMGQPVRLVTYLTSHDEAEHLAAQIADDVAQGRCRPRDVAIFYRVNSLSRGFENALRNAGVPYQIVRGLEFYQRKEIKDVLAYLHLLNNPRSDVALRRIINTPPRKIGKRTVERLSQYARHQRICLLDAARQAGLIDSVPKRSAAQVAAFVAMYDRLSLVVNAPLEEIMGHVLAESGYEEWLMNSEAPEDEERLANVKELLTDAREFDMLHPGEGRLEEFLEQTSLVSDVDEWELETDRVSLMTLHAAKGLEFPIVYIVAVEEGFLPHRRSRDDPEQLEEERRLLFVGITRARQQLQLSHTLRRLLEGSARPMVASSFLMELPREEMQVYEPAYARRSDSGAAARAADAQGRGETWEDDAAFTDEVEPWDEIARRREEAAETDVSPTASRVMTAAEMVSGADEDTPTAGDRRVPPEQFRQGMVIRHPEGGLGKIIALSGEGQKRIATVQFFDSSPPRKFVLAFSQLEPVRSGSP